MSYESKCHKVWQYGYQKSHIDQTNQPQESRLVQQK